MPATRVDRAPRFESLAAAEIAKRHFSVQASAEPLPSERDQNFRLQCADGSQFVLKVANADEAMSVLDYLSFDRVNACRWLPSGDIK